MKLSFVGAALLISVLSTDAQRYIPDLPPPWPLRHLGSAWPFGSAEYPGFRDDVPLGNSIPQNPSSGLFRRFGSTLPFRRFGSEWPFRRFGSDGKPGFRDSAYFGRSIPQFPPPGFPKPFSSEWPFRRFGSEWPFRRIGSERLFRPFGSAGNPGYWDDVYFRNSIPQRLPFWFPRSFGSSWPFRHFGSGEPRRNPLKIIPTFKISCGNPMNLNCQPFLPTYGYLGFPQGCPFYPQGFPFYSQGYSEQQSNYWDPSNPVVNSYPNLVPPEPFPGQPLSPAQPQIGYVPSVLYRPQNYAGAALSPLPQYVFPPLAQRAPSAFAYRAPPAPPLARPAPPPRARPTPPSRARPAPPRVRPAPPPRARPTPPPRARPAPPPRARPTSPPRAHPTLPPHAHPAPPPRAHPASVSSAVQSPDTSALPVSESAASKASGNLDQKTSIVKGQTSQKSPQTKPEATEEITELDI